MARQAKLLEKLNNVSRSVISFLENTPPAKWLEGDWFTGAIRLACELWSQLADTGYETEVGPIEAVAENLQFDWTRLTVERRTWAPVSGLAALETPFKFELKVQAMRGGTDVGELCIQLNEGDSLRIDISVFDSLDLDGFNEDEEFGDELDLDREDEELPVKLVKSAPQEDNDLDEALADWLNPAVPQPSNPPPTLRIVEKDDGEGR